MINLKSSENEVSGIIYPIKKNNIDILRKRKSPVYVKYITHSNSKNPTRLKSGHYLLLYLSGEDKTIVSYAKIKKIMFLKPDEIKNNHFNQIQMERNEFNNYTSNRLTKVLIFLELDKLSMLKTPFEIEYPITMAGRYVSLKEIERILSGGNLND